MIIFLLALLLSRSKKKKTLQNYLSLNMRPKLDETSFSLVVATVFSCVLCDSCLLFLFVLIQHESTESGCVGIKFL